MRFAASPVLHGGSCLPVGLLWDQWRARQMVCIDTRVLTAGPTGKFTAAAEQLSQRGLNQQRCRDDGCVGQRGHSEARLPPWRSPGVCAASRRVSTLRW